MEQSRQGFVLNDAEEINRAKQPPLEAESFLGGLLDNSSSAIFVVGSDCRLMRVNRAFERLVGLDADRLAGMTAHEMHEKEDADRMVATVRRIVDTRQPVTFEATFTLAGEKRTFINALFPILDGDKPVAAVCGIITEITERKRYESELRVAHRALVVLGECNSAVIFAKSELALAQEVCRIIVEKGGYNLAWVMERGPEPTDNASLIARYGIGEGGGKLLDMLQEAASEGPLATRPVIESGQPSIARHLATEPEFAHLREAAVYSGCGAALAIPLCLGDEPFGVIGICAPEPDAFDAAEVEMLGKLGAAFSQGIRTLRVEREREKARAALLESEARYRAVVEDQTEVISRFRADGTFTFVNDVYCRVFGKSREELLGNTWRPVCHADDWQHVEQGLSRLSAENPVVLIENRVIDGSGREPWMQFVNRGFFDSEGNLLEIQSVGRDITRQKQLQEDAMRSARLASIGELAAGLAHEINNPINGIINCAQLLADDAKAEGRDGRFPKMIIREGRRIAEIVRSLLTMARQDREIHSLVRPEEPLFLALDLLRQQLKKRGVDISLDTGENLPFIFASKGQLQQVFLNLLTNALHSLNMRYPREDPGKRLELSLKRENRDGGSCLVWRIRDYGLGIKEEAQSRLFDPFFTTKGPDEGTGLGLSISRSILLEHGGSIELVNATEQGAEAVVVIPAAERGVE